MSQATDRVGSAYYDAGADGKTIQDEILQGEALKRLSSLGKDGKPPTAATN